MKVRDISIVFINNRPSSVYFSNAEIELKDDALFVKKERSSGIVSAMYPLRDILKFTVNTEAVNKEVLNACSKNTKK